jgi:hypothetical protein
MKLSLLVVIAATLACLSGGYTVSLSGPVALHADAAPTESIFPGLVDVRLKPGKDISAVRAMAGTTSSKQLFPGETDPSLSQWWEVEVPPGDEASDAIRFAEDPDVALAEPVQILEPTVVPNDECYQAPYRPRVQSRSGDRKRSKPPPHGMLLKAARPSP